MSTCLKFLVGSESYLNSVDKRIIDGLKQIHPTFKAESFSLIITDRDPNKCKMPIDVNDKRNPLQFLTQDEINSLQEYQ